MRVTLVHPRTGIPERVEVDAGVVANAIFGALYSPVTASMLPLLLDRAANGSLQGLVAMAFAGDAAENVSVGMQLSVLCSEDAPQVTRADVIRHCAARLEDFMLPSVVEFRDALPLTDSGKIAKRQL